MPIPHSVNARKVTADEHGYEVMFLNPEPTNPAPTCSDFALKMHSNDEAQRMQCPFMLEHVRNNVFEATMNLVHILCGLDSK